MIANNYKNNVSLVLFKYFKKIVPNNFILSKRYFKDKNKEITNNNNLCYVKQKQMVDEENLFLKKGNFDFEQEFKELKEKIVDYINKDLQTNSLIPFNTKIYVPIEKNNEEILLSYLFPFYFIWGEVAKTFLKYNKQHESRIFEYYDSCESKLSKYYEYAINNFELGFFSLKIKSIESDLEFTHQYKLIQLFGKFIKSTDEQLKKYSYKETEKNQEIISLLLGFLKKSDAILYKKQILRNNYQFYNLKSPHYNLKKKNNSEFSIKIKSTTISGIKYSLQTINYSKEKKFSNSKSTFILVPKFFNYNFIFNKKPTKGNEKEKNKNKKVKEVLLNFPGLMLTKVGFKGIPIYKTKQIEKKLLFNNRNNFKKINISPKYLKTKTFFTTINKDEYENLIKKDKKKLFFYNKEEEFTDNINNIIKKQNKNYLIQIRELLLKIKNKSKTINKLRLIKEFFNNNYNEKNLLEKTNYFIDTINKNIIKLN
jgi:hypothetical protein